MNTEDSLSWSFHFNPNLVDRETSDLSTLLNMLEPIHMSLQPDNHVWIREPSGMFTFKSFCSYLIGNPSATNFHIAKDFWKVRVPLKGKVV